MPSRYLSFCMILGWLWRTAQLNFNVLVNKAFLRLRLRCSGTEQMREPDDLGGHMTERHLSKYVSSTRVNSCESFSAFAEAYDEVTEVCIKLVTAIDRYLEPESLDVADSDCRSDSTSSDDGVVPPAESPKPAPRAGETFRVGDAYPPRM
eukprot:2192768-Pleurochrysis_carterae.AAC.2